MRQELPPADARSIDDAERRSRLLIELRADSSSAEIVIAEDSAAPLELEPALADAAENDDELDETSEGHDEEGEFDLAAMLDEDDAQTSQTIGTLIGAGVGAAIGRQVDKGDIVCR